MPDKEQVGPITLERCKAIKEEFESRVEELGRKLGIPEDREFIIAILQIDEIRILREQNEQLHAGHKNKDGRKFDPLQFFVGLANYVSKEIGAYLKK